MPVSENCKKLVETAGAIWPTVYPEQVQQVILARANEWSKEEKEQMFSVRQSLLVIASSKCGLCKNCSLHTARCCFPVWGDGLPNARVFVVSEGPGQYEQRTGIPFTAGKELQCSYCLQQCQSWSTCYPKDAVVNGQPLPKWSSVQNSVDTATAIARSKVVLPPIHTAAEFLNTALDGLFTREAWNTGSGEKLLSDLYITNLVKCRSVDKHGKDCPPKEEYCKACWEWLNLQLTVVQPQVLILLGTQAGKAFFDNDKFKITKLNGKFGPTPETVAKHVPSSVKLVGTACHPSYVMRQTSEPAAEEAMAGIRKVFESAYKTLNGETL